VPAAAFIYREIRRQTMLPVILSPGQIGWVWVAALIMATISALLAVAALRRADPADVF
jgi:ABC-type lipoprotein release transport system permease subunit